MLVPAPNPDGLAGSVAAPLSRTDKQARAFRKRCPTFEPLR
jgi:hypothetical protein